MDIGRMSESESVVIDIAPLLPEEQTEQEETPNKPKTRIDHVADWLNSPKTIIFISTVFLAGYMAFIQVEGGFSSQFLHFGPGTNEDNTTSFIGIVLDTWSKTILMYFVSFLSSLMNTYYLYAMTNNLHSYIWNRAITNVPFSKKWTYIVILSEPLLVQILQITSFFTTLTLQLQFILPQFIGSAIVEIPFTIAMLRLKTFESK
jgi:hypothetical protein